MKEASNRRNIVSTSRFLIHREPVHGGAPKDWSFDAYNPQVIRYIVVSVDSPGTMIRLYKGYGKVIEGIGRLYLRNSVCLFAADVWQRKYVKS